jgi:predicted transcriptional regulator
MAMGSKRDRLEIIAEILGSCSEPKTKTHIMYGTNLSWKMLQQYLSELQSRGLLEVHGNSSKYVTTKRGLDFVKKWKELKEFL